MSDTMVFALVLLPSATFVAVSAVLPVPQPPVAPQVAALAVAGSPAV